MDPYKNKTAARIRIRILTPFFSYLSPFHNVIPFIFFFVPVLKEIFLFLTFTAWGYVDVLTMNIRREESLLLSVRSAVYDPTR